MKAFAENVINCDSKIKICYDMDRKCRKKENAGLPALSPFCSMFPRDFFLRWLKVRIGW